MVHIQKSFIAFNQIFNYTREELFKFLAKGQGYGNGTNMYEKHIRLQKKYT